MLYDLSNEMGRKSFKTRVNHLYQKGCVVELTEKAFRTPQQNKYLHLILGWFAKEYGESIEFVKEEYFKRLVNNDIYVSEKSDPFIGIVKVTKSTRDVSKELTTVAIERFRDWSAKEAGIYLPSADEQDLVAWMEQQLMMYNRI